MDHWSWDEENLEVENNENHIDDVEVASDEEL